MGNEVQSSTDNGRAQAMQDKLENTKQEQEDKKASNQIKAFEQLLQEYLRRRSSWPEKDRPQIGRAKAARAAVVNRFNRHEHRLCYRLVGRQRSWCSCRLNWQSHGNACDCRVPVAHLLVALRQPPIDRAPSASTLPNPFFRRRRVCVTLLTFFRWQRGYLVGVWPAM